MAAPAGHLRPGRYLAFFALIVVALYALVFFTGSGKPTPKLGIDLQGGTRVTLTARNPDGGDPPRESLEQARSIIERRVNGIGVSGTEVVLDGSNVVITVPGEQGDQAKTLGKTAKLGFRKVVTSQPVTPVQQPSTPPASGAPSSAPSAPPASPGASAPPSSPANGGGGAAGAPQQQPDENADEKTKREIEEARNLRQNPDLLSTDQAKQAAAAEKAFAALNCDPKIADPLVGNDLTDKPLVACGDKNTMKYLLEPE
ncbi:protein translocase subunit SecD, partial [Amycolatopsis lurida]